MSPLISSPANLPASPAHPSGGRGRATEQPAERGFGAMLERSRARAPDGPRAEQAPTSAAPRRPARDGEGQHELSAADVLALLAPWQAIAAAPAPAAAKEGLAAGAASGGPVLAAPGTPAALAGDAQPQPGNAAFGQDGFAAAATGARTTPDALAPDAEPAGGIPQTASDPPADNGPLQPAGPGGDAGRPAAAGTQPVAAPPAAGAVTAIDARPAQAGAGAASATRDAEPPADAAAEPVAGTTAQPAEPGSQQADALASVQDLPQLAATPPAERAAVARTAAPVLAVSAPVGSQEWGPAVGQQMVRMSAGGHQVAELNLNPAGLGPLKVTLTMGDSQAQAMFVSAHESVRKAVEAALPQLRATLAEQGISLGQASVGADTRQPSQQGGFAERQPERAPGQPAYPRADGSSPGAAQPAARSEPLRRGPGELDTFA